MLDPETADCPFCDDDNPCPFHSEDEEPFDPDEFTVWRRELFPPEEL